ncbi:MAG: hypothetical protein BMS9Abin37_0866 [Acidobacteriota bacterium]|nr:MAG: hypothetical protein BMS9Abin37_0866 [Acidobacteriota bacterium]
MDEHIREQFERIEALLARSPERGRDTAVSKVRIRDGLACEIEEGPWKLTADMGKNVGGTESGPTPGVYGRAALGSCMAITYAMWAAKLGVSMDTIEIEIQADFDSGAMFATADVPAGYSEVRSIVTIESDASEDEIGRLLDEADAHSPYVDVFTRGQKLTRSLRLIRKT